MVCHVSLGDAVGHGIQPIRYRMLKRMDSFNLSRLIFETVLIKIISQGLALSCCIVYQQIDLNYDQVSDICNVRLQLPK